MIFDKILKDMEEIKRLRNKILKKNKHKMKPKNHLRCALGFHKAIRSQPYQDGEIISVCKYCNKELD